MLINAIHSNAVLAYGIQVLCDHNHEDVKVMSLLTESTVSLI